MQFRIHSEITTHIILALNFIIQQFEKPAKYKNDSQTAKSHLIYQNFSLNQFFVNLPMQELQNTTEALPRLT